MITTPLTPEAAAPASGLFPPPEPPEPKEVDVLGVEL